MHKLQIINVSQRRFLRTLWPWNRSFVFQRRSKSQLTAFCADYLFIFVGLFTAVQNLHACSFISCDIATKPECNNFFFFCFSVSFHSTTTIDQRGKFYPPKNWHLHFHPVQTAHTCCLCEVLFFRVGKYNMDNNNVWLTSAASLASNVRSSSWKTTFFKWFKLLKWVCT